MFLTVLENAVKYSDEGKEIWIETTKKVDAYYISMRGVEYRKRVCHLFLTSFIVLHADRRKEPVLEWQLRRALQTDMISQYVYIVLREKAAK